LKLQGCKILLLLS